jgi:hypothetical protein
MATTKASTLLLRAAVRKAASLASTAASRAALRSAREASLASRATAARRRISRGACGRRSRRRRSCHPIWSKHQELLKTQSLPYLLWFPALTRYYKTNPFLSVFFLVGWFIESSTNPHLINPFWCSCVKTPNGMKFMVVRCSWHL